MFYRGLALAASLFSIPVVSAIPWNATEYLFVFGDSYTTDGYNISAGINSPDPGYVSIICPYYNRRNNTHVRLDIRKWPKLG